MVQDESILDLKVDMFPFDKINSKYSFSVQNLDL